jgi:hypothetical protein
MFTADKEVDVVKKIAAVGTRAGVVVPRNY